MNTVPHGLCECKDRAPDYCGGRGPAAFVVLRGDKNMRVCTKCDLLGETKTLLVTKGDSLAPYEEWDSPGAFCLGGMLAGMIEP